MIVPDPSGSPRPLEAGGPMLTSPKWFPNNRHMAVAVSESYFGGHHDVWF
jgi:hypothetical protein